MNTLSLLPEFTTGPLDPVRMFLNADVVVQVVMAGLLFASVWVWAAIIAFSWRMSRLAKRNRAYEAGFWEAQEIAAYHEANAGRDIPAARIAGAAMTELHQSTKGRQPDREGLRQRLATITAGLVEHEADKLAARLNVLATVGTSAPFVGLFGTVWGIMRTLSSYSQASFTMATVAPELSEALFATAMGLFAAIPAVIGYNRLSLKVNRFESRLQRFADRLHATMSRELEMH